VGVHKEGDAAAAKRVQPAAKPWLKNALALAF
jgi:hypothetical protein